MAYQLKKSFECFRVVDGPFANTSFQHGETYEEIPPQEVHKFEQVKAPMGPEEFIEAMRESSKGKRGRSAQAEHDEPEPAA